MRELCQNCHRAAAKHTMFQLRSCASQLQVKKNIRRLEDELKVEREQLTRQLTDETEKT